MILIAKNEIIEINLEKVPSMQQLEKEISILFKYIQGYFSKQFHSRKEIEQQIDEKIAQEYEQRKQKIAQAEAYTWKKRLIYFPIFNFLMLSKIRSNMYFHIMNGISISIVFIVVWVV
jgi:hypothetical protein